MVLNRPRRIIRSPTQHPPLLHPPTPSPPLLRHRLSIPSPPRHHRSSSRKPSRQKNRHVIRKSHRYWRVYCLHYLGLVNRTVELVC